MRDSSGNKSDRLLLLFPELSKFLLNMTNKLFSLTMLFSSILIAVMALFAQPVMAQTGGPGVSTGGDQVQNGLGVAGQAFPAGAKEQINVPDFVHKIINWALYIAAIAAVIFVIIGGYFYIFSAGNAANATKGRTTLVNALIGLAVVVLSYIIVQVVYNFLINRV